MAKQLFNLPNYYEGLRARRLRQSGRLWLVRIINDPPPYWLVFIRNFDLWTDGKCGAKSIGAWRFLQEDDAIAKYEKLVAFFPPYPVREPTAKQLAARQRFADERRKSPNELAEGG